MKKNDDTGQALIELIIFLPMMFMLYSLISGFANAINASINQQKITRAYFYFRVQHNSTIPKPDLDESTSQYTHQRWTRFGMFFIGWKDYFGTQGQGNSPVMPCYKISLPLGPSAGDNCDTTYTNPTSQFIRVGTVYGICGATYNVRNQEAISLPDDGGDFASVTDKSSCYIQ